MTLPAGLLKDVPAHAAERVDGAIYRTKKYGIFKIFEENRIESAIHIEELADSIREEDLLFAQPIIINELGQLIDGQHRLGAARKLKRYVYFIVVPGLRAHHMIKLNVSRSNWKYEDYLEFYLKSYKDAAVALQPYKLIQRIMLDYKVPIGTAFELMESISPKDREAFKKGCIKPFSQAKMTSAFDIINTLKTIKESGVIAQTVIYGRYYIRALRYMSRVPKFKRGMLQNKARLQLKEFVTVGTVDHAFDVLLDVYNFRTRQQDRIAKYEIAALMGG